MDTDDTLLMVIAVAAFSLLVGIVIGAWIAMHSFGATMKKIKQERKRIHEFDAKLTRYLYPEKSK